MEAGGRDAEREGCTLAEEDGASVAGGNVDEHAWSQTVFGEGGAVFVQRDLVC